MELRSDRVAMWLGGVGRFGVSLGSRIGRIGEFRELEISNSPNSQIHQSSPPPELALQF